MKQPEKGMLIVAGLAFLFFAACTAVAVYINWRTTH